MQLEGDEEDECSSSLSSSEEDGDEVAQRLPKTLGAGWEWIFASDQVTVPTAFHRDQYTKQYALLDKDTPTALKKELKRFRRWWTKGSNLQRQSPAIGRSSVDKRVERALCFLGYVRQYGCLAAQQEMTLVLLLNHRLMDGFYNTSELRRSKDGR